MVGLMVYGCKEPPLPEITKVIEIDKAIGRFYIDRKLYRHVLWFLREG